MKAKLILFISAFFLSVSCQTEQDRELLASEDRLNVSYGADMFNAMDIYLPPNRNSNTRVLILLHGGYWYAGSKNELTAYAKYFRDRGFACITMNYRLTNTPERHVHPAQINDIAKAIAYISARASDLNLPADKIGLMGFSAGAHLAMLYSYASNSNGKVKSLVSVAGPSDLTNAKEVSPALVQVVNIFLGVGPDKNPGAYVQASPGYHVKASSTPTLLIHGKLDNIVSYQQSVALKTKLTSINVKSELKLYDQVGHDFRDPEILSEILDESVSWFNNTIR